MFPTAKRAVQAYSNVSMETGVEAADPHKLVLMLYQGALLALADAKLHMQGGATAAKGMAVSKAITIIEEGLKASLDLKAGGDLAEKLALLYQYMCDRLLQANMKNDLNMLDEITRLLTELSGAWAAIGKQQPVESKAPPPRDALSYGKA